MLFNEAYNIAYFPQAWKEALTVPLMKSKKPPIGLEQLPANIFAVMHWWQAFRMLLQDKVIGDALCKDQIAHPKNLSAQPHKLLHRHLH